VTDTLKPLTDEEVLERAIVGALRSAIHDHGPITPEDVGSAAKRVIGNLRNVAMETWLHRYVAWRQEPAVRQ
jgi:hypothetical protein